MSKIFYKNWFLWVTFSFFTVYIPTVCCFIFCPPLQVESPRMVWTRHWCERNKIHFQSLRITVFQNHKMTDWHFHTTHQIPIISVLKAALQLVWKRLSLDVQKHYFSPPFGSRVQYYLGDTLISFCIKELSCQTSQWIQPNVWLWLWKWERESEPVCEVERDGLKTGA